METRTRFDLGNAIQGWREELAAQPGLTADEQRELETHLHDSLAGLRQCGLNDEDSFWLACRRVGHPQQLAEEFAKVDPARVWRERVFWLAIGVCAMRLWSSVPIYLLERLRTGITNIFANSFFLPDWVLFYVPFRPQWIVEHVLHDGIFAALFRFVPLICLLTLFAQGRMDRAVSALRFLFQSRRRFLVTAGASLGIYHTWAVFEAFQYTRRMTPGSETPSLDFLMQMGLANAIVSAMLVGLIAWLMPAKRPLVES